MSKRARSQKPLETSKIEVIVAYACVIAIRENDEDHKWRKKMANVVNHLTLKECHACGQFINIDRDDYTMCAICMTWFCNGPNQSCADNAFYRSDDEVNWKCIRCNLNK